MLGDQSPVLAPSAPPRGGWRIFALALVLGILLAAAPLAWWLRLPREPAAPAWGPPEVVEDFADGRWRERWIADSAQAWKEQDGRLVSTAENRALLIFRKRLIPPVAIEYTGQMLPGNRACDLSVWWSERADVLAEPARFDEDARSWMIQAGANENSFCAINRQPGNQRVAYNPMRLEPGRDYRFRVEIDGGAMTMSIDGVEVLRYRDRFPTISGYLAIYAYFPGKAFDDITIWQKAGTGLVPATAIGDALLACGHFRDAAAAYARVAEADATQRDLALFRKGLAERRADRADLSRETWTELADPELRQAADALRLEDLFTTGQHELFIERLTTYWRDHGGARDELRQQWQQAVSRLVAAPGTPPTLIESYLEVRDRTFRDDAASASEATTALSQLGRYEEIITGYPQEHRAQVGALLALGRTAEAERLQWLIPADYLQIRFMRGEYEEILRERHASAYQRAFVLAKLGRGEEVNDPATRIHPVLLHLGRAEELLAYRPLLARVANEALLAAGRFDVAAGPGLPDVAGSGGDWRAFAMLGRIEEAEALRGVALPWLQLMRAEESGDRAAVATLRPQVGWPRSLSSNSFWFAGLVIAPMVDRLGGDAPALERSLRRAVQEWDRLFGQRAWFLARAALGEAGDVEVLAMPTRTEGAAWLALGKALRAELADQPAAALESYRAFAALPLHQRLLDHNTFDTQVEAFVQWRLRALGR